MACVVALLALLSVLGYGVVIVLGGPFAVITSLIEEGLPRSAGILAPTVAAVATLPLLAAFFRVAVRHRSRTPALWRGAVATVALGSVASFLFATYARSLARYAVFYGSLAAVAIFMVWLWICCIALLIGVEVNAEAERRRSSFPPPPPGSRRRSRIPLA
jgi:membrane protein